MEAGTHMGPETAMVEVQGKGTCLIETGVMVAETVDSGMPVMIGEMITAGMTASEDVMEVVIQGEVTALGEDGTPIHATVGTAGAGALVVGTTTGGITTGMNLGVGAINFPASLKLWTVV